VQAILRRQEERREAYIAETKQRDDDEDSLALARVAAGECSNPHRERDWLPHRRNSDFISIIMVALAGMAMCPDIRRSRP
jgi:hypothetical protein